MSDGPDIHSVTLERGPWAVTVHLDLAAGVPRIVGLDVRGFTGEPGGPRPVAEGKKLPEITSVGLRQFSVPHLRQEAVRLLQDQLDLGDEDTEQVLELNGRRYDLIHYRAVAAVYTEALGDGLRPTKAVAEHFRISRGAAKNQVSLCRELRLLGPTLPGRAGGGRRQVRANDDFTLTEQATVTKVDR